MWKRGPDGEIVRAEPAETPTGRRSDPSGGTPGEPRPVPRRAKLGLALRLGLRDTYDYLGSVVLLSLVCSALAAAAALGGQSLGLGLFKGLPGMLPQVVSTLAGLAGLVLVGGPLAAGLFRFARNAAARQEPEVYDLAWGFRTVPGLSLSLAAVQVLAALVLAGNCYFYAAQRHPGLVVLGALFGYGLVFWALLSCYTWPLLAEQPFPHPRDAGDRERGDASTPPPPSTRPRGGAGRIFKKSALLVLDNLGYTAALALVLLVLSIVLWLTVVGGLLLWPGSMAMFLSQATRELLRKYDLLPPDPTLDPISSEVSQ
jgi:hypothetical protein